MTASTSMMARHDASWTATLNVTLLFGHVLLASIVGVIVVGIPMGLLGAVLPLPDPSLRPHLVAGAAALLAILITFRLHRPWKTITLGDEDLTVRNRSGSWTIRYEWLREISAATGIESRAAWNIPDGEEVVLVFEPKPGLRRSTAIHLKRRDVNECISALEARSRNATAIDGSGAVQLPSSPERRTDEAGRYSRKYLVHAVGAALGALLAAYATVRFSYSAAFDSGGFDAALTCFVALASLVFFTSAGLWSLSHHRRCARAVTHGTDRPSP